MSYPLANTTPTDWSNLQRELDALERNDPEVRAATESYDRMVERLTGHTLPRRES